MKRILEIAKYVGAIATISAAVWFFYSFQDTGDNNHSEVMNAINQVDEKVNRVQGDLNDYKKTTNTHRVYKAEQNKVLIEKIGNLQRNQNAIINNSTESKEILEAIKNQQLINGTVNIEPVDPIEPGRLVYNK